MVLGSLNEEMSQLDIAPPNNSAAEGSEAALSQSSKPSHTCAYCDKPATHWMCGGCSIDPYNPAHAATCYCSQICMLADRTQHKRACIQIQQRLHVHRAGFILHKIFFYWRMINFDNPIHAIEEKDDKLLVHVTDLKHIAHDSLISYVPFPDTNIVTVADALAVACVSACNDATFCLRDMLSTLMTGRCIASMGTTSIR